ncbi:MAG: glycosyltransferase family 61 protein, partial [Ignavibacteriae bacterium]|nr:glycosyltransferase family 61 protein [Ignavibacteriota bacterium]
YRVGKLTFPSFVNIIPTTERSMIKIPSSGALFNLKSIDFLRNSIPCSEEYNYSKIFIARGNNSKRDYNEEEIIDLLKQFNFQIILPEKYTIKEQASIFSNAEIIIGASGAAFSNIIFCRPNTKIICFMNYKIQISIFSTIAKYLNLKFQYLVGNNKYKEGKSKVQDAFQIDINELKMILYNLE